MNRQVDDLALEIFLRKILHNSLESTLMTTIFAAAGLVLRLLRLLVCAQIRHVWNQSLIDYLVSCFSVVATHKLQEALAVPLFLTTATKLGDAR